jgi:hypothetical protein
MMNFGAPFEIVTDRASCFNSVLSQYLQLQRTHHLPSTPYHPNTNGVVERVNGVLGNIITKMTEGTREKWDEFVKSATFILNARRHSVTGYSPFFLVYGISPRLPGDTHPPCIYTNTEQDIALRTNSELIRLGQHRAASLRNSQLQSQTYATSRDPTQIITYQVGEFVKLKHYDKKKFEFRWQGPFIIDRIGPHFTYYLKKPDGSLLPNPHNGIYLAPWSTLEGGVLSTPNPASPVPYPRRDSLVYQPRT